MLDFLKFLKITQETVLTQHTTLTPEILAKFDSEKKKLHMQQKAECLMEKMSCTHAD